jgi:hypothetical protein
VKTLTMLAGLMLAMTAWADDAWYGKAAPDESTSVTVAALVGGPEALVDQPLMVTGRITDVCTNRGCWAVFEDNGEILRIMARDHSFAMPAELRGQAVAHGVLERVEISPEHARHLVEDDGADPAVLEQQYEYRLIADGVRLLSES